MLIVRVNDQGAEVYGTKRQKVYYSGTVEDCRRWLHNLHARARRREKNAAMKSLGLVKVKGAMGGAYWE
jgi:hypothetical protein